MIGTKVRELRNSNGYGLREFARMTGCAVSLISYIETKPGFDPKVSTVRKLAKALGVSVAELIEE